MEDVELEDADTGLDPPSDDRLLTERGVPCSATTAGSSLLQAVGSSPPRASFPGAHDHKALSGLVLGVYALGSGLAGAVFGAMRPPGGITRRLLVSVWAMVLTTAPLLFAPSLAVLAVVLFVADMFVAPTLITTMGLVAHLAPAAQLTESITWVVSGLSVGVALAYATSGWSIDAVGAAAGNWVPCAAALLAASTVSLALPRLTRADAR